MAAANVNNGYARALGEGLDATTNAWAADPDAPGPHWIELAWDEPVAVKAVRIVSGQVGGGDEPYTPIRLGSMFNSFAFARRT